MATLTGSIYGQQIPSRPGQNVLGMGPNGQQYDPSNPVAYTTSGVRPQYLTNQRAGGVDSMGGFSYPAQQQQAQPASGAATNPLLQMLMGGGQTAATPNWQQQYATNRNAAWGRAGLPGGTNGATGQGGTNINTSINPQPIYSGQQSAEAANLAQAQNSIPLPWLQAKYGGAGMSQNSPGVISRALPAYAQGIGAGQQASANIPFQDTMANAQHITAGQQGREGEAIDWAKLASGAQGVNNNFQMNSLQSLLSLLGAFM